MVVTVGVTPGFDKVEVVPEGLDDHEYVSPLTAEDPSMALLPVQIL